MARVELRFGAPVTDGETEYGSLAAVTIGDYGQQWQTLIVRRDILGLAEEIVPREAVRQADDTRIVIASPPIAGAAPSGRAIRQHAEVRGTGDIVYGRVMLLLAAENGHLQHLVMQQHPFGELLIVPVNALAAIEPSGVVIDLTSEAVEVLPVYRADADLAYRAREALEAVGPLAEDDLRFLRVEVVAGSAILTGHIRFRTWADRVQDEVAAVPGVLAVENQLVCDDELGQEVASVLVGVPHTYAYSFACTVHYGVVELRGRAEEAATAEAAAEMAAHIPVVRGVVNRIDAPGFVRDEDWMEPPAIGEPVYGDSGLLGSVERVVIDPSRRSLAGVILDLRMPKDDSPDAALLHRASLVSRAETGVVTEAGVFLEESIPMKLEEQPVRELVVPPPPDWRPPFPYASADVAWPAPAAQPLPIA
jgi:osmotically-inducible protein OsmY